MPAFPHVRRALNRRSLVSTDQRPLCFVIGPFGNDGSDERKWFEFLMDQVIRPAAGDQYEVRSALHDPQQGNIVDRVTEDLERADVVVADLTFQSPNVFWEVGWRQAKARPCVLVCRTGTPLAFNVSIQETIILETQYVNDKFFLSDPNSVVSNLRRQLAQATNSPPPPVLGHSARFFDWKITYSSRIATEWLAEQSQEVREAVREYEAGGGMRREGAGQHLTQFAEYLELKGAASQIFRGKLFYIVDLQDRQTEFGYGLFEFPGVTVPIEAEGRENDDGVTIAFRQPSRDVKVPGLEAKVRLPPYEYSVRFLRRTGRLTGDILHPESNTLIGEARLKPSWLTCDYLMSRPH